MNQVKRQLSVNQLSDAETGKFSKIMDHKSITYIEDLSNELFYEIFEYLDGCDIYEAFTNLNFRIQSLITCSPNLLKIRFQSKPQPIFIALCRNVFMPNRHNILSLYFENKSIISNFFTHCIFDASFDRLQSIVFRDVSISRTVMILVTSIQRFSHCLT